MFLIGVFAFAPMNGCSWCWHLHVEARMIAYKENTKLGRDSIGANQNGARKHHFRADFSQLN
jgi:hypothetical protein